jgi:hypothetical protein
MVYLKLSDATTIPIFGFEENKMLQVQKKLKKLGGVDLFSS